MDYWSKFGEYGLVGLMIAGVMALLFFIVKWVLEHTKELLLQQAKERDCWQSLISEHKTALTRIVDAIDKHDEKADERGRYVREEHKEMMVVLSRINGYKS